MPARVPHSARRLSPLSFRVLSLALLSCATLSELVFHDYGAGFFGPLRWQLAQRSLYFPPHAAYGYTEDTLAALNEVDNFVVGRALVDGSSVGHEGDLGQVLHSVRLELRDCESNLLKRYARVQEALDDLEYQNVAKRVQALAA